MDDTAATPSNPTLPPAPDASTPTRRQLTGGHIVALVIGCLLLLPGFGLFVGGGAAAVGQAALTDDGYFEFTIDRVGSDGVAVTTGDLRFDDGDEAADWLLDWLDVDVRLLVEGAGATDEVFIGIARTADVDDYLRGASYNEIVEFDGRTPVYRVVTDGEGAVAAPGTLDIWVEQVAGPGLQELTWEARGGSWSVVVMNADGTPDVAADVEAGARSGLVMPIAITLMIVGGLMTATAVGLVVWGARGQWVPIEPAGSGDDSDRTPGAPFDPPAPTSAVALDGDRTPEPVG